MSNSTSGSLASYEAFAQDEVAIRAMLLVGMTVLLYDHCLTLGSEINYLWRGKWGLVSVIFVVNRYVVPIMLGVDIYEYFFMKGHHTMEFCKIWTIIQSYLQVASYMSIHVLVAMRVHALYGGRKFIRKTLFVSGTLFLLSGIAIVTLGQLADYREFKSGQHQYHAGCVSHIPSFLWTVWLPSILYETCLFVLTMYSAASQLKEGQGLSDLWILLLRDGILYFVAVALCTLFTLITWAALPASLLALARYFSLAMINVAGARLVLNLKTYAAECHQEYSVSRQEAMSPFVASDDPIMMQQYGGDLDGRRSSATWQIASESTIGSEATIGAESWQVATRESSGRAPWQVTSGETIGRVL